MYNRQNDNMHERTRLTDDYLSQCINELQNMITACQSTINGKSFMQACRDVNLDPQKTGDFLAGRLMNLSKVQTPVDKSSAYDGYKHFYIYVFGENAMKSMKLPSDYKESVLYVLNNTGLSKEDSDLVQKRFGIGSYDRPSHINNMAETTEGRNKVNLEIRRIISECRKNERSDILTHGMKNSEEDTSSKTAPEEKHDLSLSGPDEIRDHLKDIPVRGLGLIQPTVDSLKAAGMNNVYDVLCMTDEDIDSLPVRHEIMRSEIRTAREIYTSNNFGVNLSGLMNFLSEDDGFTKAVESMSITNTAIER